MTNPLLSICIATYNRAAYIAETLNSIIPQVTDEVEIIIVDGASTDDTSNIIKGLMKTCEQIRYVCLPMKGGVDHDYDRAIELAHGEFCWLFTDDDLMKPGAVDAVRRAIYEGHCLIIVNAEVRDRELEISLVNKQIDINSNKIYSTNDMVRLFSDSLTYLSFIGAIVIRRTIWLKRKRKIYYGTEFIHVGVIFQKPLPSSTVILAIPYIIIRYGSGQWKPRHFDVWMFKWPKIVWSFDYIPDNTKQSIVHKEPWRRVINLLLQRGRGAYTSTHYYQYFSTLHSMILWKSCAWLISRLPVRILSFILYYYGSIIKANAILLYDLDPRYNKRGRD